MGSWNLHTWEDSDGVGDIEPLSCNDFCFPVEVASPSPYVEIFLPHLRILRGLLEAVNLQDNDDSPQDLPSLSLLSSTLKSQHSTKGEVQGVSYVALWCTSQRYLNILIYISKNKKNIKLNQTEHIDMSLLSWDSTDNIQFEYLKRGLTICCVCL